MDKPAKTLSFFAHKSQNMHKQVLLQVLCPVLRTMVITVDSIPLHSDILGKLLPEWFPVTFSSFNYSRSFGCSRFLQPFILSTDTALLNLPRVCISSLLPISRWHSPICHIECTSPTRDKYVRPGNFGVRLVYKVSNHFSSSCIKPEVLPINNRTK